MKALEVPNIGKAEDESQNDYGEKLTRDAEGRGQDTILQLIWMPGWFLELA